MTLIDEVRLHAVRQTAKSVDQGEGQFSLSTTIVGELARQPVLRLNSFAFLVYTLSQSLSVRVNGRPNAIPIAGRCCGKVIQMLFRPSFCANCGEKIERAEWSVLTSRRFCRVCEIEYKGHEWLPRFVVGASILIGVVGFGGYLNSGSTASNLQALKQPRKSAQEPASLTPIAAPNVANTREKTDPAVTGQPEQRNFSSTFGTPVPPPLVKPKAETDEPMNYCGAETKKGTPCSRRVKGNIRCFQHVGMPAMASAKN